MTDTDINVEPQGEVLHCQWKDCLRPFTNHQALNQHLCDDHIGWKKDKYCCEWTGCSKQGVKCHNRFALIVHIRTHTGEKLYECDIDGCGLSFGRMDVLEGHKKTDHGIDTQQQHDNHIKNETIVLQNNNNNSSEVMVGGLQQENRKRKLAREEDYNDKHKREKNEEITTTIRESVTSDIEESEDMETYDTSDRSHHHHPSSSSSHHHHHQQKPIPSSSSLSNNHNNNLSQNKYKVAKAKLQYILRENEMLSDEWSSLQRKLKRLQTERRVLLDVLMSAEDHHDDDMYSFDGGDDEEDNNNHYHHNDTTSTTTTATNIKKQEHQQQSLDNQPTMVDVL